SSSSQSRSSYILPSSPHLKRVFCFEYNTFDGVVLYKQHVLITIFLPYYHVPPQNHFTKQISIAKIKHQAPITISRVIFSHRNKRGNGKCPFDTTIYAALNHRMKSRLPITASMRIPCKHKWRGNSYFSRISSPWNEQAIDFLSAYP